MFENSKRTVKRDGGSGIILLLIVIFSFIARLFVSVYHEEWANRLLYWGYDECVYFSLARHMGSTSPFDYTLQHSPLFFQGHRVWYIETPLFIHPPLFSWALMSFFYIGGSHFIIGRFMNVLLGTAGIALTYLLGRRISPKVGILSALFLSLSPLHLQLSSFVLMEMMLTVWVTLFFLCVMKTVESESTAFLLLSGLVLGAGLLTKYPMMCVIPLLFFMTLVGKMRWTQCAGILLIGALLFLPWILWNLKIYSPSTILEMWRNINSHGNSTDVPFYAYLTFLPVVSPFVAMSYASISKHEPKETIRLLRNASLCVIATFLVFHMIHPIKDMRFILPIFPFMAVLAGDWLATRGKKIYILLLMLSIGCSLFADLVIIRENYLWYLDFWHYGDWYLHFLSIFSPH